jgi:hypothetical protein
MFRVPLPVALALTLLLPAGARAGLYYSGEPTAELPSQWRGFLLDQRALLSVGIEPKSGAPVGPLRQLYLRKAIELEGAAKTRRWTAEELADLGAIYIRLGKVPEAVGLLRQAQREHPNHFFIAANLGTAWQLQGDLQQAALGLEQAVRLAPGKYQPFEEYHLKLVRLRLREPKGHQELDELFGVRYLGDNGEYVPGKLAAGEKKKLPARAAAIVQQLCLWLPGDARLLWQLAELANAYGDVRIAANMMDGCVTQFGLHARPLRQHRQVLKAAVEGMPQAIAGKTGHEGHVSRLPAKSHRPLLTHVDAATLPPVSATGINMVPWSVFRDTQVDRKFHPTFPAYLKLLDGKKVTLTGFMQPFNENQDINSFMLIEYPVGCWFCEMPEMNGILHIELPRGQSTTYTRGLMRVTGRLVLNATDPEEFLFAVRDARVAEAD